MLIPINILYYAQYNIERIFMNYCVYLRKRKNKPFCKLLNKEIPFCRCQQCGSKEYKSSVNQIKKKSTLKEKSPLKIRKMKTKSNRLAKLEKNRFSVFTDDLEVCILCGRPKEHIHEIIYGKNRLNSIKYNFVIPLCANHHTGKDGIHFSKELDLYYKRLCQIYFENNLGDRTDFIKIFGRSYL